jgi:hypothetical protein
MVLASDEEQPAEVGVRFTYAGMFVGFGVPLVPVMLMPRLSVAGEMYRGPRAPAACFAPYGTLIVKAAVPLPVCASGASAPCAGVRTLPAPVHPASPELTTRAAAARKHEKRRCL